MKWIIGILILSMVLLSGCYTEQAKNHCKKICDEAGFEYEFVDGDYCECIIKLTEQKLYTQEEVDNMIEKIEGIMNYTGVGKFSTDPDDYIN